MLFFGEVPRLLLLILFSYGMAVLIFTLIWRRHVRKHAGNRSEVVTDEIQAMALDMRIRGTSPLQITNLVLNCILLGITVTQLFLITLPLFLLVPIIPVALVTNGMVLWRRAYITAEAIGARQHTLVRTERTLFWITYGLGMASILLFLPIAQSMSMHTGPM